MLRVKYAECHKNLLMLSVVMLNVIRLSVVALNVVVPKPVCTVNIFESLTKVEMSCHIA
jgi:hypothetical protein